MRPRSPRAPQSATGGDSGFFNPDLRMSLLRKTHERQLSSSMAESRDNNSLSTTPTGSKKYFSFNGSGSDGHSRLRDVVGIAAATALVLLVLLLVALCTVAILGHPHHSQFHGFGRGKTTMSRGVHLLAEGLASVASSIDGDAVEEYAPERGYVRKALHHTQDQVQEQIHEKEVLQEYYDTELALLSRKLEDQKLAYEKRLEEQQKVLLDVFGDDVPKKAERSTNVDHEQLI